MLHVINYTLVCKVTWNNKYKYFKVIYSASIISKKVTLILYLRCVWFEERGGEMMRLVLEYHIIEEDEIIYKGTDSNFDREWRENLEGLTV